MHASNVAFLLLAASAAAPAFAAPLSARTPAGVPFVTNVAADTVTRDVALDDADIQLLRTFLTSRSEDDGAPFTISDIDAYKVLFGRGSQDEVLDSRSLFSDLFSLLRILPVRDVIPDELAARSEIDDFISLFNSRDVDISELQTRSFSLSNFISSLESVVGSLIRRDVPSTTVTRDDMSNIINAIMQSRNVTPDELTTPSNINDFIELLKISSRDVGPSELEARFSLSNFISSLESLAGSLIRRDVGPSELEARFSLSNFISSLESLAGSLIRRDVPTATTTRDDMNDLWKTLMQTRDFTPEQLSGLALLLSRSSDDLD